MMPLTDLVDYQEKRVNKTQKTDVSKSVYEAWERKVTEAFYVQEKTESDLVPKDGSPAVVSKEKVVVVVLEGDGAIADMVAAADSSNLPAKDKVQLFHIGKKKADGVSYGLAENGKFVHPGIDLGGLTNYQQKLGEKPVFVAEKQIIVRPGCDSMAVAKELYIMWAQVAQKQFPKELREDLERAITSVQAVFKTGAVLRFWQVPPEHRVIVTSNDVRALTGKYYVRCFGKGEDAFAVESDDKDLFAGVAEKYITPNINMNNIMLEYRTYSERERRLALALLALFGIW